MNSQTKAEQVVGQVAAFLVNHFDKQANAFDQYHVLDSAIYTLGSIVGSTYEPPGQPEVVQELIQRFVTGLMDGNKFAGRLDVVSMVAVRKERTNG